MIPCRLRTNIWLVIVIGIIIFGNSIVWSDESITVTTSKRGYYNVNGFAFQEENMNIGWRDNTTPLNDSLFRGFAYFDVASDLSNVTITSATFLYVMSATSENVPNHQNLYRTNTSWDTFSNALVSDTAAKPSLTSFLEDSTDFTSVVSFRLPSSCYQYLDVLPLRKATAEELKRFLKRKTPKSQVFSMPCESKVCEMLQEDLTESKIPYEDDSGRFCDFHAFRHTTGTFLAANGVHPKVAMAIMRHSKIDLTMSVYTHMLTGQEAQAVDSLPDLTQPSKQLQESMVRATGTDGAPAPVRGVVTETRQNESDLLDNLLGICGQGRKAMDDNGREVEHSPFSNVCKEQGLEPESGVLRGGEKKAAIGFEPMNYGFANRSLRPLGHAAEGCDPTRGATKRITYQSDRSFARENPGDRR